ncbi:hypothetical protein ACU9D5_001219 [Cronobacter dublinensis]|uniref:Spore coat protein U domain-containing protein n=1 Tax=Cronobacter dublinensis TaxID=413497 RepID=A0A9Q4T4Z2_9ENTR|nr:hypothetical protein [Cronobacter dublinensis]NCH88967.1 hypothetical protein [Cronobacter dublinensis]NHV91126.1 hypothetical protein [Cronobacter dublinensis]
MRYTLQTKKKNKKYQPLSALIFTSLVFLSPESSATELAAFSQPEKATGTIGIAHPANEAPMLQCLNINGNGEVELSVPELNAKIICSTSNILTGKVTNERYTEFHYVLSNNSDLPADVNVAAISTTASNYQDDIQIPPRRRCTLEYLPTLDLGNIQQGTVPVSAFVAGNGSGNGAVTLKSSFIDANGQAYLNGEHDNKIFFKILKDLNDTAWNSTISGWKGSNLESYYLKINGTKTSEPGNYTGYLNVTLTCS